MTAVTAPLSSLVGVSLENYKWAKEVIAENKTFGPHVSPLIAYTEGTTKQLLEKSPLKVEDIVSAVDTRVEQAVNYSSKRVEQVRAAPGKLKTNTLIMVHDNLNKLKLEKEEETPEEELSVATIAEDAKVVTAERLSLLLDASEGYLAQYLPISEEDREEIKVDSPKGQLKPVAVRVGKQGKVAAKKLQEQALAKARGLKKRTDQVVHVDLVKYSEFLDKQKENVKQTIYISLEKLDEKLVKPAKDVANRATEAVDTRVISPAKAKIEPVLLPVKDSILKVWTVVGDEYNQRVVLPRDQIVQMFREELALQQEIAKQKSGEDLTITAGLKAVVAAARSRLSKEWEVRVSPTLAKVLGRGSDEAETVAFEEEDVEEKSYVDEEEEVASE